MTALSRNPFARTTFTRARVYVGNEITCTECGSVKQTKKGRKFLFIYQDVADTMGVGRKVSGKPFDCVGCYRAYHNL